jgi:hypothetical protein
MQTTKKCPMCAEEIPLTATSCEFCDAKFEVTSSGYCQNCHEVRKADEKGQCKVCGNTVVDLRIESRFIEEKVHIPVSEPISTHRREIRPSNKIHLPAGVFAGILVLVVGSVFMWFANHGLPAVSNMVATDTAFATMTFTPMKTSTASLTTRPTLTQTPRPTPTATPDRRILNPANQHLYLYVKKQKTWHAARDYCATLGGHLVTIQAPSENKFVYDLAVWGNTDFGTWLGGTDEEKEGSWKWVTGEDWRYHSWDRDNDVQTEPDNKDAESDYLRFDGWDKDWHSSHNAEFYFVCEWEQ